MPRLAQRIGLIGVSLGVAAGVGAEWVARQQLERRYQMALETRRHLELAMGELRAERDRLAGQLVGEQQRADGLVAELTSKDEELQRTMDRLAQEERTVQDLRGKLFAMEHQFDQVQGELAVTLQERPTPTAQAPTPHQTVELEKVVVTHPLSPDGGLQGRVISIDAEWKFVVIDLGWDVVRIGDVISIYRQDQLLGKARVERVQEQVSAATLLPEWNADVIQVNDVVRAL